MRIPRTLVQSTARSALNCKATSGKFLEDFPKNVDFECFWNHCISRISRTRVPTMCGFALCSFQNMCVFLEPRCKNMLLPFA